MSAGIPWIGATIIIAYFTCYVNGEMRFVCPRPQLPNSAMIEGPCGTNAFAEPFEANFMEVTPGPLTVHLEETISHKGAPIRIALMEWNKNTGSCILLDHIPHNDAASPIITDSCNIAGYPLGHCFSSQYYLTVQIPDIQCDKCVLQMINVATDMFTDDQKPCYQRDDGYNNCTTFYSCANIRIRPTPNGVDNGIASCAYDRLKLRDRWPYTPVLFFEIKLGPPFSEENYLLLYERPDWTIEFELNLSNRNISVRSGSAGIFQRGRPISFFLGNAGRVRGIDAAKRELLHNGTYIVRITGRFRNGTFTNIRYPIKPSKKRFQDGFYSDHGVIYSPGGFLSGRKFEGPKATYIDVNIQAGECQAQGKETFGAVLTFHKSILPRALLTFSITSNLMFTHIASSYHVTRLLYNTKWNTTDGKPAQSNMIFNRNGVSGYVYEGSQNIRNYLAKTGGRTPTGISLVIDKDGTSDVIFGQVQKGIKAEIKHEGKIVGLAMVVFNQKLPSFNIYVMVSNASVPIPNDVEISLVGPTETFPISTVKPPIQLDGGAYFTNVTVPIIDMEIPQFLWTGSFSVIFATTNMTYTGQLEKLSSTVCEGYNNVACRGRILLTPGGKFVDRGAKVLPPTGIAMVAVSSAQMLMDISISVQDVKEGDTFKKVKILKDGNDYLELPGFSFQAFSPLTTRRFAKSQMGLNAVILTELADNLLSLSVTMGRPGGEDIVITGRINPAAVSSPGFVISKPEGAHKPVKVNPGTKPVETKWQSSTTKAPRFDPFGTRVKVSGSQGRRFSYLVTSMSLVLVLVLLQTTAD